MDDVKEVRLKRSDSIGLGFSVFGGKGSGFPPVIYQVVEQSPAAVSGVLEAGDVILEVNDKNVVSLTTKEVLKCLRLSNDVVTLKVRKDASVKQRVHSHMAASSELESLRRSHTKENGRPSTENQIRPDNEARQQLNGELRHKENVPPKPKFESFVMTGELIIKTKSSTNNLNFNKSEDDLKNQRKTAKRESSDSQSPVQEKKSSYGFVRTSRSEDFLQKTSVSTVNVVEIEEATSFHNLLETSPKERSTDQVTWSCKSPVSATGIDSQGAGTNSQSAGSNSEVSGTNSHSAGTHFHVAGTNSLDQDNRTGRADSHNPDSRTDRTNSQNPGSISPSRTNSQRNVRTARSDRDNQSEENNSHYKDTGITGTDRDPFTDSHRDTRTGQFIHIPSLGESNEVELVDDTSSRPRYRHRQDGVTNIVIDENKIYVKVQQQNNELHSDSPKNNGVNSWNSKNGHSSEDTLKDLPKNNCSEDARRCCSPEDESDIESLNSFHYSPKAVDMPSASRLAKRLFYLEGFKKSDVSRHLCKNNDFSRVVGEEYLGHFDFRGEGLDEALRKFLKRFCLIGETQERERVLVHFSKRFLDCNQGAFKSQDAVHTLTCALMLLNTDLHGENVGRRMTCTEFVENLAELNEGENFSKEVLKTLYHSIKTNPLEWAVDDEEETPTADEHPPKQNDQRQSFVGHNPFLEVPNPNCATEYKRGYVMRKCCVDPNGKKTPMGKRGWKMFYADLRDLVLYLHKDENGVKRNQLYDSLHNAIRVHHSLATRATDYTKKQHVFRLQTADQAEYLFQTSDSKELQSWVDTLNYVAASLSAPSLEGACGAQKRFQRPLLPAAPTKLNFREQLLDLESKMLKLEKEIEEHLAHPPERSAKSRVINEFNEKEQILQYELKRYRTYIYLLRSKVSQFPELDPPLVHTSIGEVDEETLNSPPPLQDPRPPFLDTAPDAKRSLTDRFSYRAAIYKTET